MTMFLAPYTAIADIDGSPLDAGFIFFGEFGKNPESFPISVYWDADFAIPAAQPIRTRNGYPIRNGSPCKIYLKQAEHSLVIKNKNLSAILVEMNNKGISSSLLVRPNGDTVETSLTNIDAELNDKQQQIDEKPSQQYVDEKLDLKAPQETTYTKLEVDSALSAKAPQETTYTKLETDVKFSAYVGGRKGFTTLALAQAGQSTLTANTVVDVTNDPDPVKNGTYQWNGTTLTKSAYDPLTQAKADATTKADAAESNAKAFTSTQIEVISKEKVVSLNLFDPATVSAGTIISLTTGATSANAAYFTSDWIPILPSTYYAAASGAISTKYVQYDANKVFISEYVPTTSGGVGGATASNAAFMRLYDINSKLNTASLNKSNYSPAFQAFSKLRFVDANNVINLNVKPEQTSFVKYKPSMNLVNPTKVKAVTLNANGFESASAVSSTTDFIAVKPNTLYSQPGYFIFAEYDANKNLIIANAISQTVTTSATTAFIRTGFANTTLAAGNAIVVEGVLPYNRKIEYSDGPYIEGLRTDITWYDKKVLWLGTSIPNQTLYPEFVADDLGFRLNKRTIGGGRIRAFKQDGSWEGQTTLPFQFSLSKADVNTRYSANLGKLVKASDYLVEDAAGVTLTQAMLDALTVNNYENLLVPYIAETDLFIIDYGVNDRGGQTTYPFAAASTTNYDRSTLTGSFNFIIKTILDAKPNARIVIVNHHNRVDSLSPNASYVVLAQNDVAQYWGLPLLDICNNVGMNELTLTAQTTGGDNLHPIVGGIVAQRYAKYIVQRLKEINY